MKRIIVFVAIIAVFLSAVFVVFAHPGRTDGKGGHYNRSTGEYHYHHGYSEHNHYDMDGDGDPDCPYTHKKSDYNAPVPEITLPQIETFPELETIPKYLGNYNKTTYNPANSSQEKNSQAESVTKDTGLKPDIVGILALVLFSVFCALILSLGIVLAINNHCSRYRKYTIFEWGEKATHWFCVIVCSVLSVGIFALFFWNFFCRGF